MSFKSIAYGVAFLAVLGVGSAKAATYNIAFTLEGDASPSWFGTFEAPDPGGSPPTAPLTSFQVEIGGILYNTITDQSLNPSYYPGPPGQIVYPGPFGGGGTYYTVIFADPLTPGGLQYGLVFINDESRPWYAATCSASGTDCTRLDGSYDISPVPLPAALPLLGAGLAGLGAVGWVRRRRGQRVAA